jgi:Ca2+-binding RTX toxin-like protein
VSAAMRWDGTVDKDTFVFNDDYDDFDFVKAGRGNDLISDGKNDGYWSSDEFYGQRGDDTLISNDGDDLLKGGRGDDTFIVDPGWFDPAEMQFHAPGTEHAKIGFQVTIFGGRGHDVLEMSEADARSVEYKEDVAIIHTGHHGTITVHGVEEFHFL